MKTKDWLLENGYPEFMKMTRDNLEIILDRFAAEKLKQERNKAIQSCIEVLINDDRIHFNASDWLEKLESLKDKSHE